MSEAALWTPEKAAAVEEAFGQFLRHVRINSKEKGGDYLIVDGIYEAQKRYLRCIFDGLADDIHDFKILKSRQLGVTTITRALVIFWLGIHRGMQGAMVFDTTPHLEEARQEIRDMMRMLPASLKFPAIEDDNRYGMRLSNNSRLRFMSAGIRNSRSSGVLGRSSGINLVAASEMCSWENDEGVTSLKNSLSRDYPDRLYIWESTARGPNVWQDMWEEAQEDDLNQRTCFIGWWAKDNQRIRRGSAKWERYGNEEPTEREARRIGLVRDLYDFEVDAEQLAWYRELTDPNRQADDNDPEDSYLLQDQPWCVVGSTRVGTQLGIIPISEVFAGAWATHGRVTAAMPMGKARIWRLRTNLGYEFEGTDDHPVIDVSGDRIPLKEALGKRVKLSPPVCALGEYTAEWRRGIVESRVAITPDFARLVGLFMGDGHISGQSPRTGYEFGITCDAQDRDVVEECHRLIRGLFGVDTQEKTTIDSRFPNAKGYTAVTVTSKLIYETFRDLGLVRTNTGKTMRRVHVPEFIWRSPKPIIREFLRGLFEADGFNDGQARRCVLFSKWEEFLKDVQLLLLAFGITSRRRSENKVNGEGRVYLGNVLQLRSVEAASFNEKIGFLSARKQAAFPRGKPGRNAPARPLEDEVVFVEDTDREEEVYNITVGEAHVFDANGVLTHNTEDEAFQLTGSTFFDYGKLGEAMRRAASFKFQAFKFWPGSERPNATPGSGFLECEVMPARTWRETEIKIWEEPVSDAVYVVAADPAFGHSEDSCNSAIEVIRCYADCVEQVAEYTCPSVSTHQFAWVCASLVGYYGAPPNSRVLYILELNGPGEAVWREYNSLKQLLTSGYLRPKAREKGLADIFANMRNYIYQRSDAMGPGHNYHWVASTQRKVAIMERLRDYVHSFMLLLRSRDLIEEMRSISRAGDQIGAERGRRDDRVIAMAMAVRAYEEKLRMGLVSGNRTREADIIARRKSPVDMAALYNRNIFDQFFRVKQLARAQREAEMMKASWRYR